jgi:hypothetical protein
LDFLKGVTWMKRSLTYLTTLFLVLGLTTGALGFSISVTVDGQAYNLTGVGNVLPETTVGDESTGTVKISGIANADPSIAFGITVVDFGAPSQFGFSFSIPNNLAASPATTVRSSLVGGLTDFTGNSVSISPVNSATLMDNFLNDLPAFVWSVGPGLSGGQGDPGALYAYGPYTFGPAPGPANPPLTGFFTTTLNFTLSGDGDIAALTGFCDISPAPVPATLLLLGSGLLGLASLRLRKK